MKKFKIEPALSYTGSVQYDLSAQESRSTSRWAWRPWSPRWEIIHKGTLEECMDRVDHLSKPTVYL